MIVARNCASGIFYVEEFSEKLLNIRRGLQKTKPAERVRAISFSNQTFWK